MIHKLFDWYKESRFHLKFGYLIFNYHFGLSDKEDLMRKAMLYIRDNNIEGDYLEFGSYIGKSFSSAYFFSKLWKIKNMRYYSFDSFKGFPKTKKIDNVIPRFKEGEYSVTIETFKKNIIKKGVNLDEVEIIKGYYHDSLTNELSRRLKINNAAIVNIDCDLYESTQQCLDFITDYLVDGMLILFDDWNCYKSREDLGEQRGFSEWLQKNPQIKAKEFLRYGWGGNSFIIHIKHG